MSVISTGSGIQGPWTAFTPSWAGITVGNGTNNGYYMVFGKTIFIRIKFVLGTTSSVASVPTVTLPVTSVSTGYTAGTTQIGMGDVLDSGTATFYGFVRWESTTTASLIVSGTAGTYENGVGITSTVPMTWAVNDAIEMNFMYEGA